MPAYYNISVNLYTNTFFNNKKPRYVLNIGAFYLYSFYTKSLPWQALYFLPLPHGQGSLRPIFCSTRTGADF